MTGVKSNHSKPPISAALQNVMSKKRINKNRSMGLFSYEDVALVLQFEVL